MPTEPSKNADFFSKVIDFEYLGVHVSEYALRNIDRFAKHFNSNILPFNSLAWVSGVENLDEFSENLSNENTMYQFQ